MRQATVFAKDHGETFPVDPAQLGLASGGGRRLPDGLRGQMETALGADFDAVRIHVGPQAPRIGAVAFTTGSDIYFAPGRFQPETLAGQRLLAHELAHVIQQRQGRVRCPTGTGLAVVLDRALEMEADRLSLGAATRLQAVAPRAPVSPRRSSRPASLRAKLGPLIQDGAGQENVAQGKTGHGRVAGSGHRRYHAHTIQAMTSGIWRRATSAAIGAVVGVGAGMLTGFVGGAFAGAAAYSLANRFLTPPLGTDLDAARPFLRDAEGRTSREQEIRRYRGPHRDRPREIESPRYFYQATTYGNLSSIMREGLRPDRGGRGGASEMLNDPEFMERSRGRVHGTAYPHRASFYAFLHEEPEEYARRNPDQPARGNNPQSLEGMAVILRFPRQLAGINWQSDPDDPLLSNVTRSRIPPQSIEALTTEGWVRLGRLAGLRAALRNA